MDNVRTCHHLEFVFAKAFQSGTDPHNIAEYADEMEHPFIRIEDDCTLLAVSGRQVTLPPTFIQF